MAVGILNRLRPVNYLAAGTLQKALEGGEGVNRGQFYALLDAMIRAGLIEIEEAEFEKDGQVLRYRKVMATEAGCEFRGGEPAGLLVADGIAEEFSVPPVEGARKGKSAARTRAAAAGASAPAVTSPPEALSATDKELADRLRQWRSGEAKRLRVATFMVLPNGTLDAIARTRPKTPRELLDVKGMGAAKVEKFGAAILEICQAER